MLHYCYIKICYCFGNFFFSLSVTLFVRSYLLVFSEILQINRNLETEKSGGIVDFPEKFFFTLNGHKVHKMDPKLSFLNVLENSVITLC